MESQNTEWKESWRDDYLKWVSAFANAQGGTIEIGRNDDGVLIGLPDAEKLLEELPNKIRSATGVLADVNLCIDGDKEYIVVNIKPYPAPITYHGRYYYRSGSTTQELSGMALEEFMLRKQGRTWDGVPVPNVTESEFQRDAFNFFRKKAVESTRLSEEDLAKDDNALLESLTLIEGKYLKRAALLLFHQTPEKWVPGAFVKIGFFENDVDILYQDEIRGPLISIPDKVLDTLYLKYFRGLISYRGIQRIETYPVARAALREAVLNAVVHKDYSTGIPIQIRVYEDKVDIFNPGSLPYGWTVEKLVSRHESNSRNPLIAGAFFRAGLIETWGRGIERIFTACKAEGKAMPLFESSESGVRVLFTDDKTKKAPDPNKASGTIGSIASGTVNSIQFGTLRFDEVSDRLLYVLGRDPALTYDEISKLLNIPRRTVSREMKKLQDNGILVREGNRKNGSWVVRRQNEKD